MLNTILKLSRWQEFIPWTLPLTLLGGLMAYRFADVALDGRLVLVLLANFLAMAFAFMINDIEDSDDDRHTPERGARNAVTSGQLSRRAGWIIALSTAALSALLYALAGGAVLPIGLLILGLALLYSWKPVRLKALPIVDILSHVLMLSALLLLAGYFAYDDPPGGVEVWLLTISMALLSGSGQFYNQVRDYADDRAAGLRNTASVLGQNLTRFVGYASIVIAVVCLLIVIFMGAFPLWLLGVIAVATPLALYFLRGYDARWDKTEDSVGQAQVQFTFVANAVLIVWFLYVLVAG